MPPELSRQLVYQLDAWYRSHEVRQKDLATELELSPQQLSEILSLRNRPTADQILTIQTFLLKDNPMSTRIPTARAPQASTDDDPIDFMNPQKHASWGQTQEALGAAQEEIIRLRAELKSQPAAPALPASCVAGPPCEVPDDPAPALTPPPPATTPTTIGRAKSAFADLTTDRVLADLKEARMLGNAELVGLLLTEVKARSVTSSSSNQPPAKPLLIFPSQANTPALIRQVFDQTSMEGLREMLQTEKNPALKKTIFLEIKRREKEGLK